MSEAELQADAETPASPFVEQLHMPPQFGIIHLMLWTAVTAVLLHWRVAP